MSEEKFCARQFYGIKDRYGYIHSCSYELKEAFLVCGTHLTTPNIFECPYKKNDIRNIKRKKMIVHKDDGKLVSICTGFKPL